MITEIRTDNYTVVESNVVYLNERNATLKLHFEFSNDFEFDFILYFTTDSRDEKHRIERLQSSEEKNELKIACINFDNPLGTGTIEPLEIATIEGNILYIQFWSFLLGGESRKTRKVEYTIFIKG